MSKFKVGHRYKVTHIDNSDRIRQCVVKIIGKLNGMHYGHIVYEVLIIKSKPPYGYENGLRLQWYEDWCSDIKEIKNNDEFFAIML